MFTKKSFANLQPTMKAMAIALVIGITGGLLVGGAQPVAVGLIPPPFDKLAHAAVFFVLSMAIGFASGMKRVPMALLAFFGAMLVAVLDEWHQFHLPGRSSDWDDLIADALGAAIGALLLLRRANKKVPPAP